MNNEELKKKIVEIIINAIWKDAQADYDSTDESEARTIADALIAAGIGFDKSHLATFQELDTKLRVAEHRAEVAERALDKAVELAYEYRTEADTLSCSSCPVGDELFPKCKDRGLYKECSKRWKEQLVEQAKKELAEDKKDENI